ncbi:Tigger transposable element-derived protein 4 [Araneus ventricosus]|uniref:Tigger transposable element-derived protein 4 n=1 Tax=Araneus ventricosus TaxID=182803 RepID=A0A4Y2HSY2_ARAVE|nr:Tigger transposable element-derived protein 4 [Araneus ventricosus]
MKIRNANYPEVEECVRKWFAQCHDQNLPVGGSLLQQKAEDFAKELDSNNEFKANNDWLENFKKRHNNDFRKLCSESASVDASSYEDWLSDLPSHLKDYKSDDVFIQMKLNCSSSVFPTKRLQLNDEECHAGKQGKLLVTVLLTANQSGKEKLPPLMIRRYKKPRCFAKIKSFPMMYKSNPKVWMTSEIFGDWLNGIDKEMAEKKRRILLFIGNCNAHYNFPALKKYHSEIFTAKYDFEIVATRSGDNPELQSWLSSAKCEMILE